MNRQTVLIAIAILAVLALFAAIVSWKPDGSEEATSEPTEGESTTPEAEATTGDILTAELYFPGAGGWLRAESREVPAVEELTDQISVVIGHLLAGPSASNLLAPLPEGVTVRQIYLSGTQAFVDFESAEPAPPASGSMQEMLTVYSLVNTVLLNFEQLDRVVLLWNGQQLRTFAGHVDTMRPLATNAGLVARELGSDSGTTP